MTTTPRTTLTPVPLTPLEVCQLAGQILDRVLDNGACCTEDPNDKGKCAPCGSGQIMDPDDETRCCVKSIDSTIESPRCDIPPVISCGDGQRLDSSSRYAETRCYPKERSMMLHMQ